jgi:hypothetical protein
MEERANAEMVILTVKSRGYEEASALWGEVVAAIEEMHRAARG